MHFKLSMLLFFFSTIAAFANNIQVTNVSLSGQNTVENFTMVEFDITWENSWRLVGGPGNWDAAWIFVKYRVGAGEWKHAWLNNTGHTNCAGTTVSAGLLTPSSVFHPTTNPCLGVFLYRADPGSGTFDCTNVQLRWNYGENGLSDNEQVDIKVFAIEHVYVPEGSFKVGSGGAESGPFYAYPLITNTFEITSEGAITVAASTGNLYYQSSGDQLGPIPALFPKGYNDFYMMKYEISQQGYVDFLNTLTRPQQSFRIETDISSTPITNVYVMTETSSVSWRNGIWSRAAIPPVPSPIIFFCNLINDGSPNEISDGHNLACNYLSWGDVTGYLDWAGLRPMTEFEFEKCSRGPIAPVPNEFCWGDNYVQPTSTSLINYGYPNEVNSDTFANLNYGNGGPVRCGILARPTTNRTFSGATYYGAMDFGGNVWELGVTIGTPFGRSFEGNHGDGLLNAAGQNNVSSWPEGSSGPSLRGGSFSESYTFRDPTISGRRFGSYASITRQFNIGGRGCRSAPN